MRPSGLWQPLLVDKRPEHVDTDLTFSWSLDKLDFFALALKGFNKS
jgi:hypothetical protein